jgi:hypothetical protein
MRRAISALWLAAALLLAGCGGIEQGGVQVKAQRSPTNLCMGRLRADQATR